MSTSSVVFVGIGFERQLFNEHELFPEPMGRNYTALGQVGEYTYGTNGTYRFIVLPNKVTLQHESETVLSDELMEAANQVAEAMRFRSQGHGVTGVGFNIDTVFAQSNSGVSGVEFCRSLCNSDRIRQVIGSTFHDSQWRVVVLRGGMRYTLRLEPHTATSGANLFLGANAHQDVAPAEQLTDKLAKSAGAKEYIQSVASSLSREFEGEEQ